MKPRISLPLSRRKCRLRVPMCGERRGAGCLLVRLAFAATESRRAGRRGGGIGLCFSQLDWCDEVCWPWGFSLCASGVGYEEAGI